MNVGRRFNFGALFLVGFLATSALAQTGQAKVTQYVPDGEPKAAEKATGFDYTLSLSANLALAQNSNMVGQPEGTSYLIGLGVIGSMLYLDGPHELKTSLTLVESFTKTPVLDRMVKANDLARLEGLYSYYFLNWLGAFGRLGFESPLLLTEDLRSELVDYSIAHRDGTIELRPGLKTLRLAEGFQPLTLLQSAGLVGRPLEREWGTVTMRVGAGARETLADGVLVNKDDKATAPIELVETGTVVQGGAELALGIAGKLPEQRLTYGLDGSALFPFLNNDPLKRDVGALARLGLSAYANFSMFEWLGITYQLLVQRDPQLIAGIQAQNNLFLTFKYDVIPAKKAPPKVDPLELAKAEKEAAERRALEAEVRAKLAEDRLKALEEKKPGTP